MTPNFKKVKVFGRHRSFEKPVPLGMPDSEDTDLEAGTFLSGNQRSVALGRDVTQPHHQADNPYLDEYRS